MSLRPEVPTNKYSNHSPIYSLPYPSDADVASSTFKVSASEEARLAKTADRQMYGAYRAFQKFPTFLVGKSVFWTEHTPTDLRVGGSGVGAVVNGVYFGIQDDSIPETYSWSGLAAGALNYLWIVPVEEEVGGFTTGSYKSSRQKRHVGTYATTSSEAVQNAILIATFGSGIGPTEYIDGSVQAESDIQDILRDHINNTGPNPHGTLLRQTEIITSGTSMLGSLALVTGNVYVNRNLRIDDITDGGNASYRNVSADTVAANAKLGTTTISSPATINGQSTLNAPLVVASGIAVDGRDISYDGSRLSSHVANVANPHTVTAAQLAVLPTTGGNMTGPITAASGIGVDGVDFSKLSPLFDGSVLGDAWHTHSGSGESETRYLGVAPKYRGRVVDIDPQGTLEDYGTSLALYYTFNNTFDCYFEYPTLSDNESGNFPTFTTGVNGYAASFNGSNPDIMAAMGYYVPSIRAKNISVSCWAKWTSDVAANQILVAHCVADTEGGVLIWKLSLYHDSGSYYPRLEVSSDGSSVTATATSSSSVAINTWAFITATIEDNGTIRIYVDGVEKGSAAFSASLHDSASPYFSVGGIFVAEGADDPLPFTGAISDVAVWAKELSAEEVSNLYSTVTGTATTQFKGAYQSGVGLGFTDITIPNLKGSWLLNDLISGTGYDNHGRNHMSICASGIGMGAGIISGKPAPYFNRAQNQYLYCPYNTTQNLGTRLTFACWVKFTTLPGTGVVYTFGGRNYGAASSSWSAGLWNDSGTYKLFLRAYPSGGGASTLTTGNWTPSTDTWYHLIFRATSSNLYINVNNGSNLGGASFSSVFNNPSSPPLSIGGVNIGPSGRPYTGPDCMDGVIDCVVFSNQEWSADERTWLYRNYLPGEWTAALRDSTMIESGQTIKATADAKLARVDFFTSVPFQNMPSIPVVANVYTANNDGPQTLVATSESLAYNKHSSTLDAYSSYFFDPMVEMTSGTDYAITLSGISAGNAIDYLRLRRHMPNPYSSGSIYWRGNDGAWHPEPLSGRDLVFRTWMHVDPVSSANDLLDDGYDGQHNYSKFVGPYYPLSGKTISIRQQVPLDMETLDELHFWHKVSNAVSNEAFSVSVTDTDGTTFYPAQGSKFKHATWTEQIISGFDSAAFDAGKFWSINVDMENITSGTEFYMGEISTVYST